MVPKEQESKLDEEVIALAKQLDHETQGVNKEQENPNTDMTNNSFDSSDEPNDAFDADYHPPQDLQI